MMESGWGLTSTPGGLEGCWRRRRRTDFLLARAGIRRVEVDRRSLFAAEGRTPLARRCIGLLMGGRLVDCSLDHVADILAVVVDDRTDHLLEIGRSCAEEGSIDHLGLGRSSWVGIGCKGPTS